jgi:ADP-heptose:LPS heptosyltransferase
MNTNTSRTRFLLIQTAFIGDAILATPLIEKLKETYPHATIDLFLRKGNEELFTEHPYLSTLYVWDKKKAKYGQLFSLIHRIRKQRYDVCINLQRHGTTGLVTLLSGAPETIGFTMNPFSRFFTRSFVHRIGYAPGLTHETDLYLQLLTGIVPDLSRIPPRLYPHGSVLTEKNIRKPYITVAPASVWFTKQYPSDKWVKVINLINKKTTVYLIGAVDDYDLCATIAGKVSHPEVKNLAGSLSLLQSAALMKDAEMNYVNDSAPLHIASAVDAPVTAVFCSTVTDFGYGPSGTRGRVVETTHTLSCRPCGPHGHKKCPQGHFRCADIPPGKVLFPDGDFGN